MSVTSVTPVKETEAALACKLVQRLVGAVVEPINASPNPTLVRFRATPDGLADKSAPRVALRLLPPMVMTLTWTPSLTSLPA